MELTFAGHATVAIEGDGLVVLTDPVLRGHVAFLRRSAPPVSDELLDRVDVVLVSHLHHDHCDPKSLTRLPRRCMLAVPAGSERWFRRQGFDNLVPMRPGDSTGVGPLQVTATEANHNGRREPFGPAAVALGFCVTIEDRRVYFAGDTDLFPGMTALGGVDVALLPVAGWGPRLGPGHLDPVRAAEAVAMLQPQLAIPVHWGALRPAWHRAPTDAQRAAPAEAFADEVRRRGLPAQVQVTLPGATTTWRC